jgi:hypothetical protein
MACVGLWEISVISIGSIPWCFIVILILTKVQNFNESFLLLTFFVQVFRDSFYNLGMEQCIFKKPDNEIYISPIWLVSYNIKIKFLSQARFLTISLKYGPLVFQLSFHFLFLPIFSPNLESNAFQFYFQVTVNSEHFVIVAYFQIARTYEHLVTCIFENPNSQNVCPIWNN